MYSTLYEAALIVGPPHTDDGAGRGANSNGKGLLLGCVAARVGGEEMISGTRSPD